MLGKNLDKSSQDNSQTIALPSPSHQEVAHPFACQQCPKKFSSKQHLEMHVVAHTGEIRFSCEQCPKKFRLKQHLEMHLAAHDGDLPFCDICHKTFHRKSALKKHRKIHRTQGQFCPGVAEISREVKQSKRELSVSSGSGKTLETTPALMLPPSGGVKRANRERRVASVRGSLSVIRQVFTIQLAPNLVCMMLQNQCCQNSCNFLIVFACLCVFNMGCQVLTILFYRAIVY